MGEGRVDVAQDDRAFFFNLAGETGQILNATAKWLSTEDEKQFRLVSRFFFTSSLPSWRSKTSLRVDVSCPCLGVGKNPINQDMLRLDEAIGLTDGFDDEANKPAEFLRLHKDRYHSITLHNWICYNFNLDKPNHGQHDQLIITFFRRMNTVLNHIVLQNCYPIESPNILRHLSEVRKLISVVFKNCRSSWEENHENEIRIMAKHLTMDPLPNNMPRNFRWEDRPWAFFNHFPVLQTLTLHLDKLVERVNPGFIRGLRNYRDNIGNNPLRIEIAGIATFEGTITEFLEAAIPIDAWTISSRMLQSPGIATLLHERSLKLVKLSIDKGSSDAWDPAFPFQVELPSLKELHLFGKVTNSFNFLRLLRFMPAVQKVVVRMYGDRKLLDINSIRNEDRVCNFVSSTPVQNTIDERKYLTYLDIDCYLDLDGLRVLRAVAPGIMFLRTALRNNEMFQFVCEKWKMLTDLTLCPGSEVDESVIPNLTKLNNLTSLKIWNSKVLTDMSVNEGFLRMEKLSKLSIFCRTSISERCKELLRARWKVEFGNGQYNRVESSSGMSLSHTWFVADV